MGANQIKQGERASRPLPKEKTGGKPVLLGLQIARRAFTMLELLVAMAVFSLLIVLLMGMVDGATKLWRENENRVDSYREARAAIGVMERDLRNAITTNNPNYYLINNNAFGRLSGGDVQKDVNTAGAIFFLSAQPAVAQDTSANKSDICGVGYFIGYGNTSVAPASATNTKTLNLYRYFLSSDGTYSNLVAGPNALFNNVTMTGAETDLLARNIKSFRITPYHIDTNNSCVAYDSALYGTAPDFVEISLTALNQDISKKLDSAADWTNSTGQLANAVKQVEQTFTTRIPIPAAK